VAQIAATPDKHATRHSNAVGGKYHFLLRRLHSLSGIIPVGVFVIFHLFTNAQLTIGDFQHEVEFIHALPALLMIEIVLWLSIGFHAGLGIVYTVKGAKWGGERYEGNWRYILQRVTGILALVFIFFHIATLRWRWEMFGLFTPNTHTYRLWSHAAAKLMVQTGHAESMNEAKQRREREVRSQTPAGATEADYLRAKRASDIAYIKQHPMLQLRNHVQALVAMTVMPDRWSLPSLLGIHRAGGIWHRPVGWLEKAKLAFQQWGPVVATFAVANFIFTAVLWLGVLFSLPSLKAGPHRAVAWLLFLTLLGVIAGGAINVEATPRYRLPAVPMMALLTALALQCRTRRGGDATHSAVPCDDAR